MTYVSEVTADSPLAYWRLGEPSGTSATDASGNAHTGTYGGTVTLGAAGGIYGDADTAMAVAGAGSFKTAATLDLSALSVITVEFWLKWTAFANNDAVAVEFTADGGGNNGGFVIIPNGSGTAGIDVLMFQSPNTVKASFPRRGANAYHHYVLVLDRSQALAANACVLYYDGSAQTPFFTFDNAVGGNFANSTLFAMARNASSLFATGSLDELAVYSGALSPVRIAAHYTAGSAPHTKTPANWSILPTGAKVRGGNFVPKRGTISGSFNPNSWAEMWAEWDWFGWIKPMVDNAASIGLNTVRVMGAHGMLIGSGGPYASPISQATYEAYWKELLDYCRSIGMCVYPTFGGDSTIGDYGSAYGYAPTAAFLLSNYQSLATLFANYPDIIGACDLYNEAQTWAKTLTNSQPLYDAVKAILGPNVSLTWSTAWGAQPTDLSAFPPTAVCDHWDVHIYFFEPQPDTLDTVFDQAGTDTMQETVIGEFGINDQAGNTAAVRQSFYASIKALTNRVAGSQRQCAGALAWALFDQDQDTSPPSTDHYGLWTQGGTPRQDIIDVLQTFPITFVNNPGPILDYPQRLRFGPF